MKKILSHQVIPQLIARIDHPRRLVAKLIHDLLTDVGKQHPQVTIATHHHSSNIHGNSQALIYPLTVVSKSQSVMRRDAADMILQNMTEHSSRLVQQAILVSEELIRVAILWHEQWHEGLEDASRSLSHSLSLTHTHTHTLTRSLTHSLALAIHSLTH